MFELSTMISATNGFSVSNKLGEGGFGPVFKVKSISQCFTSLEKLKNKNSNNYIIELGIAGGTGHCCETTINNFPSRST